MTPGAPYHECPKCGSAAVAASPQGSPRRLRCTRCGHSARAFERVPFDPNLFDNRPRRAGQVLPTCRERDE